MSTRKEETETVHHDGCDMTFTEGDSATLNVKLVLTRPRVDELRKVFARGLNTWDAAPQWLFDFDVMLSAREHGD